MKPSHHVCSKTIGQTNANTRKGIDSTLAQAALDSPYMPEQLGLWIAILTAGATFSTSIEEDLTVEASIRDRNANRFRT